MDRLHKDGGIAAIARMGIDDDIPAAAAASALAGGDASAPSVLQGAAQLAASSSSSSSAALGATAVPAASDGTSDEDMPPPPPVAPRMSVRAQGAGAKLGLPMRVPKAALTSVPEGAEAAPPYVAPAAAAAARPALVFAPAQAPAHALPQTALPTPTPGLTLASLAAGVKKRRTTMGRMSMMFTTSLSPVKEEAPRGDGDPDGLSVASSGRSRNSGGSNASGGCGEGGRRSGGAAAAPIAPAAASLPQAQQPAPPALNRSVDDDGDADMAIDSEGEDGAHIDLGGLLPHAPQPSAAAAPTLAPAPRLSFATAAPSVNTTHALLGASGITLNSFVSGSNGRPSAMHSYARGAGAGAAVGDVTAAAGSTTTMLHQLDPTVTFGQAMEYQQVQQGQRQASQAPAEAAAPSGRVSVLAGTKRRAPDSALASESSAAATPDAAAPRNSAANGDAVALGRSSGASATATGRSSGSSKVKFALPDYIKSFDAAAMAAARSGKGGSSSGPSAADGVSLATRDSGPRAAAVASEPAAAMHAGELDGVEEGASTARGRASKRARTSGERANSRSRSRGSNGSSSSGKVDADATAQLGQEGVCRSSGASATSAASSRGASSSASASSSGKGDEPTITFKKNGKRQVSTQAGDENAAPAPARRRSGRLAPTSPTVALKASLSSALDQSGLDQSAIDFDQDTFQPHLLMMDRRAHASEPAPQVAAPSPAAEPEAVVPSEAADVSMHVDDDDEGESPGPTPAPAPAPALRATLAVPPRHPLAPSAQSMPAAALNSSSHRPGMVIPSGLDESADSDAMNDTGDSDHSGPAARSFHAPPMQQALAPRQPLAPQQQPAPLSLRPSQRQQMMQMQQPSFAIAADPAPAPPASSAERAGAGGAGVASAVPDQGLRHSGSSSSLGGADVGGGEDAANLSGNPFQQLLASREVVSVGGRPYLKLECIGKGGSSRVYRVLGADCCVYALKRVRLSRMDPSSIASYTNEIALLRKLNAAGGEVGRHIIRLVDAEVSHATRCIHIVMEYGQIDLNNLLAGERERLERECGGAVGMQPSAAALPGPGRALRSAGSSSSSAAAVVSPCVEENLLRLVWRQMLVSVHAIHEARIVHGDLKPGE